MQSQRPMGACTGLLALLVTLPLLLAAPRAHAGKLADTRDSTGYSPSSGDSSSDDDDDRCGLLAALFFGCSDDESDASVSVSSHSESSRSQDWAEVRERREAERRHALLASDYFYWPYPYAEGQKGNLTPNRHSTIALEDSPCDASELDCQADDAGTVCIDDDCFRPTEGGDTAALGPSRLKSGRLQFSADFGQDQDDLERFTLGFSFASNQRFLLETRFTYWTERLATGIDGLWIGDLNLHYVWIALPALQSSLGIGPRVLTDGEGGSLGVNATSLTEAYPLRPLAFRLEVDAGNLGPALYLQAQATAGITWNHFEIYAGAEHLRIGETLFNSWLAGARLHL